MQLAAYLSGGAVGAVITHLSCSIFVRELRRLNYIALTCAVGALVGLLLRAQFSLGLLFLIWQPAVMFCIGLGFRPQRNARPKDEKPDFLM
jgi:hypothetical protein